ncbi:MAG: four helix bundle protein [Bacteroidota bacterium]
MNYKLHFEKYEIYHLAVGLSLDIYSLINNWPKEEKFGIISQIRRASTSIGANIAEGTSRFSEKEKARIIEIAYGSLMEVAHFLFISQKLSYISLKKLATLKQSINKIANKINAFHKKLSTYKAI